MSEIVVAITGASGVIYGVRLLEALQETGCPATLVMTRQSGEILKLETDRKPEQVESLAERVYDENDLSAPIASGSHRFRGMVVCPCSMKTLGAIAGGIASNLVVRAAEVCLKEGRTLVLVPRETPLSTIHLENMLKLANAGARIVPASPGFYTKPKSIDELVDGLVGRVLDLLGIENDCSKRWGD